MAQTLIRWLVTCSILLGCCTLHAQVINGVHKYDGVHKNETWGYMTLDTMCEANNPKPGDYLVRVHVKTDGSLSWERVRMNYTPNK